MFLQNLSHLSFLLLGIPGLESAHPWLSIPLLCMYLVTLLGNSAILLVIRTEARLPQPMYIFLSMLAPIDLVVSSATLPKMLCAFLFLDREISFPGCLTQMFFIHIHILATRLPHTHCQHMVVVKLSCADVTANSLYGLSVALYVGLSDVLLICLSYGLILRMVLQLPREAQRKAFNTCVILVTFVPGHFCILTHRFGHKVWVLLANLYLLLPPTLNSIMYGIKTREIRERVLQAFWRRMNLF